MLLQNRGQRHVFIETAELGNVNSSSYKPQSDQGSMSQKDDHVQPNDPSAPVTGEEEDGSLSRSLHVGNFANKGYDVLFSSS